MKRHLLALALLLIAGCALAQDNTVKVADLAVPSSPAFIITDITPTLVQNPNTPKSFVLGVAQSYTQSGTNFPNNYSAEFAPYWWVQHTGRNIYSLLGLSSSANNYSEKPFEGLKFTTVSVAFINKDLIPDDETTTQKIFAIGIRSTIIKIHSTGWSKSIKDKIAEWHSAAQIEMDNNAALQAAITRHPEDQAALLKAYKPSTTDDVLGDINALINQKPVFNWEIASAYSAYGISDQDIKTGRIGAWTTFSSYISLDSKESKINNNYFTISASFRYLVDNYQKNDLGIIGRENDFDIGGTAGFQFNQVNIGVESLYRYANGIANTQNRTVGVIDVKVAENIFINGTFGKDFAGPNKLITAFGINWGLGKEKVNLP